jgi:hypothetical protein
MSSHPSRQDRKTVAQSFYFNLSNFEFLDNDFRSDQVARRFRSKVVSDGDQQENLGDVRSAAGMAFGSAAGCFAGIISIISSNDITCWLKTAFALFATAIPFLITAGVLFEFIAFGEINRQYGQQRALHFLKPGYILAVMGFIALSGYFHWVFALISTVLVVVGFFTVRNALNKHPC